MSNSTAYPIAHLDSADAVMRLVDRLIAVAGIAPASVDVRILTDSHEAARYSSLVPEAMLVADLSAEMAQRLPDADVVRGRNYFSLIAPATPGLLETLRALPAVPIEVDADELPADRVGVSVLTAIGAARGTVIWDLPRWPGVEELSLAGQAKHAMIQVTLNSSDIDALTPADGHLVYVHVGSGPAERERAAWLARQVGCVFQGPRNTDGDARSPGP
ncbi:hypothetical protein GCM10010168_28880 [Actinoplanes ianthinogenes]|uniref:Uncharacterized protein n=1 Tax=Actinoplanes ianthinogenes TaxID=122358 RepID=A0ABN6C3D1_9ACTN|nr:hypothetical protein [Actinoplanes ianthinogenes]BCJ40030.1 hypothetical protein Aiant_06870 [Actinoplanes ianthinogenes]GGR09788.1 hypothetical protein GCM10010168_28880 [Actinoplanes ianthinogenes]